MIFKVKSKLPVAFDTIAFADIVINLFVFFFIAFGLFASFDSSQRGILPIQLPQASHSLRPESSKPITIMIDRNGKVYLDSRKILANQLHETLNHELSLRKEKNVVVRADRSIPLQKFVAILDIIRNTKAGAVSIETET